MNHNKIVSFFDRITNLNNLDRSQKIIKITVVSIFTSFSFFGLFFLLITIFTYLRPLQEFSIPIRSNSLTNQLISLVSFCLVTPLLEEFLFRFDRRVVKNNNLYIVFFFIIFNLLSVVLNNFFKIGFIEGIITSLFLLNLIIILNYFFLKNIVSNYIFGDLGRTQMIFNLIFIFSHSVFVFDNKAFIFLPNSSSLLHFILAFISFFTLLTMANFYTKIRNSNDSTRVNYWLSVYSHTLYNFTIWLIVEAVGFVV